MHAPDFIFDIAVARCAGEFLSSDLAIDSFAGKYAQALSELYEEVDVPSIQEPAEQILLFLSEIEAGEGAVELISDFVHFRLYFDGVGRPRKMKPLFGALDDGVKTKTWSPDGVVKAFRVFTFGLRSKTAPPAPAGWQIEDDTHLPRFGPIIQKKLSVLDIL